MPANEILARVNWVDVLLLLPIVFRAAYIGVRQGVIIEFFKISGVFVISYFTLHYYTVFGEFLAGISPVAFEICAIFSYFVISSLILAVFAIIRQSILKVIKIEAAVMLKAWGGVILGFVRGLLFTSLVFISLLLFHNNYLTGSIKQSYFGSRLVMAAPAVYQGIYNNLVIKFNKHERMNYDLLDLLEEE